MKKKKRRRRKRERSYVQPCRAGLGRPHFLFSDSENFFFFFFLSFFFEIFFSFSKIILNRMGLHHINNLVRYHQTIHLQPIGSNNSFDSGFIWRMCSGIGVSMWLKAGGFRCVGVLLSNTKRPHNTGSCHIGWFGEGWWHKLQLH